uniref:Uncharacterized protein n=1 Tax=Acrobeloides nanus TaxID=290746 RepID=A0A914D3K8_9BILA
MSRMAAARLWLSLVLIIVLLNLVLANPVPMFLSKTPSHTLVTEYIDDPENLQAIFRPKRFAPNYRNYDAIRNAGALVFLKRIPFQNYGGLDV